MLLPGRMPACCLSECMSGNSRIGDRMCGCKVFCSYTRMCTWSWNVEALTVAAQTHSCQDSKNYAVHRLIISPPPHSYCPEQGALNNCVVTPTSIQPKPCIEILAHTTDTTTRKHTVQTPQRNATMF